MTSSSTQPSYGVVMYTKESPGSGWTGTKSSEKWEIEKKQTMSCGLSYNEQKIRAFSLAVEHSCVFSASASVSAGRLWYSYTKVQIGWRLEQWGHEEENQKTFPNELHSNPVHRRKERKRDMRQKQHDRDDRLWESCVTLGNCLSDKTNELIM